MPPLISKGVETCNLIRAFRKNANEDTILRLKLNALDRQRVDTLRLWMTEVRLLKAALKAVRTCSGYSPEGLPPDSTTTDNDHLWDHPMLYVYNRKVFDATKAMEANKRMKITSQILEARAEQREEAQKEIRRNMRKPNVSQADVSIRPTRVMMLRGKANELAGARTKVIVPKFETITADNLEAIEVEKKMKNLSAHKLKLNEQTKKDAELSQRVSIFKQPLAAKVKLNPPPPLPRKSSLEKVLNGAFKKPKAENGNIPVVGRENVSFGRDENSNDAFSKAKAENGTIPVVRTDNAV